MGSSFVENCNYERSEPIIVSQSTGPLNDLRSIRLGASIDKEEAGKCCHFSIRGYVAEMRKSNNKKCWPFSKLDDPYKLEEHINLLPTITTTEFRWWNCRNCLHKTSTAEAAKDNGASMTSLHQDVKTKKFKSHGFEVVPRKHTLEGRPIQADSSINGIGVQRHPSVCCNDKRNKSVIEKPMKEGIPRCKGTANSSEGEYQIANSLACSATKAETGIGVRDITGTRKVLFGLDANKSGCISSAHETTHKSLTMLNKENASDIVTSKSKGKGLVSELADAEVDAGKWTAMTNSASRLNHKDDQGPSSCKLLMMKEPRQNEVRDYEMPQRVDSCIQKVDVHTCKIGSSFIGLLGNTRETLNLNEDLIKNKDEDQHCVGQQMALKGDLRRKKAQKVRMLNDIINSEVPGIFKKLHALDKNEEDCQTVDCSRNPSVSEGKKILQDPKIPVHIEEKKIKPIKSKKRNKLPEFDDEAPSLIQWLNRMPKKVKTLKGDGQPKCWDSIVISRSIADKANGKGLQCMVKDCGVIQENIRKVVVEKKINKVPQEETGVPCSVPWQEGMAGKNCAIVEDAAVKQLKTRVFHPRKAGHVVNKSALHSNHKIHDSPWRTAMTSKIPPEDGVSSSVHRTKDPFSTFNYGTISDFEAPQKVSKKRSARRTNRVGEQAAVDGIPIEILELLQRNWHQRQIMNPDRSIENMDDLSEMTKNVKDGPSFFSECYGKEAPTALHKNQSTHYSISRHTGGEVHTAVKSKGDTNPELNVYSSHGNLERKLHMNMNLGEEFYVPKGYVGHPQFGEQPTSGGQLHVTGVARNCCSQNQSRNRNMMQNAESRHDARTFSGQNSSRLVPNESFQMNKSRNIYPDVYQKNMLSQYMFPISHSHKSTHLAADPVFNRTVTQPHGRKQKVALTPNKRTPLAGKSSYLEVENERQPVDLYTNDTISAMHLLKLMDPAVSFSTPLCTSDKKQTEFCKHTDLSHTHRSREILQNVDVVTSEASKDPLMFGHIGHSEYPENSTKVFCPVPKIGVPKSLFQKDMAIDLNSLATPFAFEDGKFSEMESFSLHSCDKQKNKISHLDTQARTSAQSSVYVDGKSHGQLLPSLDSTTQSQLSRNKDVVVWPPESCSQTEFCVVNRNPAEFTLADEDNIYMMRYENLKSRSESSLGNRDGPTYTDGQRQQRVMKLTALKGLLRS